MQKLTQPKLRPIPKEPWFFNEGEIFRRQSTDKENWFVVSAKYPVSDCRQVSLCTSSEIAVHH